MWTHLTTRRRLLFPEPGAEGGTGTSTNLLGGDPATLEPAADPNPPAADPDKGDESSWVNSLPDELKEDATLKNFKDVKSLAAAHVALKKHLGAEKLTVPGKNSTEEDWQNLYRKLGVPEKAEDYKVEFKKEANITEDFSKNFQVKLHSLGVLPKQAQGLADWVSEMNLNASKSFMESRKAKQEAEVSELRKEWGQAFDGKVARANKFLKEHADEKTMEFLKNSGLANDVNVVKLMAKVGELLYKEDATLEGTPGGKARFTPAEAMTEARKIVSDMNHPYNIKDHPNHKTAIKEVEALFQQAASANS